MEQITQSQWDSMPDCNKGVWSTERTDWDDWEAVRDRYMGKRTFMRGYGLEVEGLSFEIVPDALVQNPIQELS